MTRAAPTKTVSEYAHTPEGVVDDTPLPRPGAVSFDDDGGVPGVPVVVDDGDGVVAPVGGAGGDDAGVVAVGELAGVEAVGELAGVVAVGDDAGVVVVGEFAGVRAGDRVEGEGGSDEEGGLVDGYGDNGDVGEPGAIPVPEGVGAIAGGG